jgi:2-C-methyl-D-erythritol 2,4-cyclodiphosphate synthase
MYRIGIGYDSHRLVKDRKLILGGVEIPHHLGLAGHSDADALTHAIIDSILGAMGLNDIGSHFPDTDARWKDASSILLLAAVINMTKERGFDILWIDSTVVIEKPKIAPFIEDMKRNYAIGGIAPELINIKAKTCEGMGFIGRQEGVQAHAVCLLKAIITA